MNWYTALIIGFSLSCVTANAQPAASLSREEQLSAMRHRAQSLRLRTDSESEGHRVRSEPLLRYNDPTQTTTDGTLWLWEVDNRPMAALCLFMDSREGFQWNYELVALSPEPLVVDGRPEWSWKPSEPRRDWIELTAAPAAKLEAARLTQMKALVAEFQGEEHIDGGVNQMRLLPRPVHRYRSATDNVLDGGIFLMVIGTNPEILVQVEAMTDHEDAWRVGFARLSAGELSVRRGDRKVWTAPPITTWNPRHEYFSHYGPDRN